MIESVEIQATKPLDDYPYEWVSAVARYAVDPELLANGRIADLGLAPRDADGLVRFSGDVVLLRPAGGGSRRAVLSVPNRGSIRLPYCGSGLLPAGHPGAAPGRRRLPAARRVDRRLAWLAVGRAS